MNETKTIREWLNELPEPYRSRALKNAENSSNNLLDAMEDNIRDALWGAFLWLHTPECMMYWSTVYDGQTPELPEHLKEEQ